MIALNNQINAAREVTKTHTSDVETFKSGDFGFLGNADDDRVIFYRAPLRRQHLDLKQENLPYVEIVTMYGGADGAMVKAARGRGQRDRYSGPRLGQCQHPHVRSHQGSHRQGDTGGDLHPGSQWPGSAGLWFPGWRKDPQRSGCHFRDNLPAQKARILLMLALQTTSKPAEIQKLFDK